MSAWGSLRPSRGSSVSSGPALSLRSDHLDPDLDAITVMMMFSCLASASVLY
jgi:hypothetical protein